MIVKTLVHILVLSAVILLGCSSALVKKTTPPLSVQIESLLAAPDLSNAVCGIVVQSLRTGNILYEKNAETSLIPASNLKLFTTATALRLLGPDFRLTTTLVLNGTRQDSIFYGDLVVRGGGDPTHIWEDSLDGVPQWKQVFEKLDSLGIKSIRGCLIADDTLFDNQPYGIGWSWENEPYYFQPQISALSINNNCLDVIVTAGDSLGAPVTIQLSPPFPNVRMYNKLVTADVTDFCIDRHPCGNTFELTGRIAKGTTERRTRTLDDPAVSMIQLFGDQLRAAGVAFDSTQHIRNIETCFYHADTSQCLSITSPPMADIATIINKNSENLHAELLLKLIGKNIAGIGSSKAGATVVSEYWGRHGINTTHFKIVDGSGLSRKNLLTPYGLVSLLTAMRTDSVFYHSLPISGTDGTLERSHWTAANTIRAKTGTLDYVKALSGYVQCQSGDELVFSFLVNHHLVEANKIIYIQNSFCQLLAQH